MNCEEAWNLISARIDGELTDPDRPTLDAHLAECAACRAVLEAFKLQDSDLRRAFVPRRRAAAALAGRAVGALGLDSWRARLRVISASFIAAAAGFALAILILRPWENRPEPPTGPIVVAPVPAEKTALPAGGETPQPPVETLPPPVAAAPAAKPMAVLTLASGRVEMELPGRGTWVPVPTGGAIEAGTRIRTGPGVLCEFRSQEGSEVRLNEETELLFARRRDLDLARGQLWTSVENDPDPFNVKIPGATVTALGTKFDLRVEGSESVLTMVEGATWVRGGGGEHFVYQGERATIAPGGGVSKERAERLQYVLKATSWVNKLLALKGEKDAELSQNLLALLAYIGEAKMETLAEAQLLELGETCVKPLLTFVQAGLSQTNKQRRIGAAKIACSLAPEWAVKDLLHLLVDEDGEVRFHAARALERLTGETHGRTPEEWRRESRKAGEEVYRKWLTWWSEVGAKKAPGPGAAQTTK